MNTYELTYIISPEISLEEAQNKAKELESAVISREGSVIKTDSPVAKPLSYPIGQRASGFFGVIEFQSEAEKVLEIKDAISKDKTFLRVMLLNKKPVKVKKQRRLKTKEETSAVAPEIKAEVKPAEEPKEEKPSEPAKADLEDIDKKLDEILGE